MSTIAAVIGRLFLSVIFILSGFQKLLDPGPTAQMLASTNLPANLALPTGAFELICGGNSGISERKAAIISSVITKGSKSGSGK